MYNEINKCRICGNTDLISILNLGEHSLSGVFPKRQDQVITSGPLEAVKCHEDKKGEFCGLVQLRHSFNNVEMYGKNYGYRSGLNPSMVGHLKGKVNDILNRFEVTPGDLIIDIGSNDSTLLQFYPKKDLMLVGIDPSGAKFQRYYPAPISLIPDFFSATLVKQAFGDKKAKIITSIAMFYDMEDPISFMRQVHEVLADDGIWIFEQSYMPAMLKRTAYDTICHEHIEYYRLKQIKWMTDRVGFKIIDISFNEVNGGSFSVAVARSNSTYREAHATIEKALTAEKSHGLGSLKPYEEFKRRVHVHKDQLRQFIQRTKKKRKTILGYGASTKGNTILQFCELSEDDIACIGEVNTDKFGCYTPGTWIPIVSEAEVKALQPDYLMVFPWHFKDFFLIKEQNYLLSTGKLVFPLPSLEIIDRNHA